jgi:hypothetical protein
LLDRAVLQKDIEETIDVTKQFRSDVNEALKHND